VRTRGVGGWDRTTVRRLTGARSTVELHRQTGGATAPPPYRISLVTEQWARGPGDGAPRPSRLGEASRGQGWAVGLPPAPGGARGGRVSGVPAPPLLGEESRRRELAGADPARRARVGRARPDGRVGTGGRGRTCIDGFRGRRPAVGRLRYAFVDSEGVEPSLGRLRGGCSTVERRVLLLLLVDPGGLEPPRCRLRGGCSTIELRVERGPERSRTSTSPLKRRQLYH
jgi:hypothetical protein